MSNNNEGFDFISLFSGAGGLDLGLKTAGFRNMLCVEKDEFCLETLRANDRKIKLSSDNDIFKLLSSDIIKESGIKKGQLTLLAGGPPCQPFSKSSYWANSNSSRMNDPRAQCVSEFMRVVNDLLPKVVLIENVTGIGYSDKNDGLNFIKARFQEINRDNKVNYNPVVEVINAADYGVPQVRKRIFIIASRYGETFKFPSARFSEDGKLDGKDVEPYRTAWDAIGDLEHGNVESDLELKGKWADLLPSIPEGQNYLWHTQRMGGLPLFGWRTRYWSFLLKLSRNKPSWTITASPGPATGPFHWRNRNLSIRELARLQTFPDNYVFSGPRRERVKQIGNSVPPAIGELIGLEIRRQFFANRVRHKLKLVPEKNINKSLEIRLKKVPQKYLELIDNHKDHPGVGRGPGAKNAIRIKAE